MKVTWYMSVKAIQLDVSEGNLVHVNEGDPVDVSEGGPVDVYEGGPVVNVI